MGSVPGGVKEFDFKAARDRIEYLTALYRRAKRRDDEDAQWEIMALIDELEREVAAAHATRKGRMTTVQGGHPVMHIENLITPIVPQWSGEDQLEAES